MPGFRIPIRTTCTHEEALLTIGVPVANGQLAPDASLHVCADGMPLPSWHEVRATWPDGSIKWLFLHVRVPTGERQLDLTTADSPSSADEPVLHDGRVQLGECTFHIAEDGWTFDTDAGSWQLTSAHTNTDLPAGPGPSAQDLQLIEASPIAPLLRWRSPTATGLLSDQLFRLDPAHKRLIWTRRVTWHADGDFTLKQLTAQLQAPGAAFAPQELVAPAPGLVRRQGEDVAGFPEGRLSCDTHALFLEHAWQRAPFALRADGESVSVDGFPVEAEPLRVKGGTSFRHTVELACGADAASVVGAPVQAVIDPAYLCRTGAIGTIAPAVSVAVDFPGYEQAFRATLETGRLTRLDGPDVKAGPPAELEDEPQQDREYFGLQHYGDWPMPWGSYGGTRRMYASNEYDPAYAYYQGYAIYGDPRYLEVGRVSAIHMTDVDMIAHICDMRFHGYNDTAEDHGWARAGGELGHYWTDGYWMLHYVHGDVWAKEAAVAVTQRLADQFAQGGQDMMRRVWAGAERNLGWPAVALIGSYEATGDPALLATISELVDFMYAFTSDPQAEIEQQTGTDEQPIVWWRTAMADGCKPFMVGVILEGLERFHRATGDARAAACIERLARFLVEQMWLEHEGTFIYEWNAYNRGHRFAKPHSLIPLFVRGLGYAYELTGDARFREVSEKAFHSCLWTLYDPASGGKSIGMIGRTLGAYVTMVQGWLDADRARYRDSISPSSGESFAWSGSASGLAADARLHLLAGAPVYDEGAVVSQGDSYLSLAFDAAIAADNGQIRFRVRLLPDSGGYPGQRCFVHLSGDRYSEPALSIISFYSSLHARIYDVEGRLIEVAEAFQHGVDPKGRPLPEEKRPQRDWIEGEWFTVEVEWQAPGFVRICFDEVLSDEKPLDRPLGGAFTRLHIGYKPGNWRAGAAIDVQSLRLGCEQTATTRQAGVAHSPSDDRPTVERSG